MIFRRKFVVTSKNDDDDGRHRRFNLLDLKSLPYTELLSCVNINLLSLLTGLSNSSSTVIVDRLTEGGDGEQWRITEDEASWVASSMVLGMLPAAFVSGFLVNRLGPKRYSLVAAAVFAVGLILVAVGRSVAVLCLGRLLQGFSHVCQRVCVQLLVCEISHVNLRGFTGSLYVTFYSLGFALIILKAAFLPWRISVGVLPVALSLVCFAGLCFMHESPVWLAKKGRMEEAEKALRFYNRSESEAKEELGAITDSLEKSDENVSSSSAAPSSFLQRTARNLRQFLRPNFMRPFLYLSVALILMEWSSFPLLAYYLVTIFKLTNAPFDPYITSVIASLSRLVSSLLSGFLIHRYRRRPLYFSAAFATAASLGAMGAYTYAVAATANSETSTEAVLEGLNWLPLFLVIAIYTSFSFGYGSITFILQGELFPSESKSFGNSMISLLQIVSSFIMVKTAPTLIKAIGIHGIFLLFSGVVTFMGIFAAIFMPETKGLSLAEIQSIFNNNSISVDDEESNKKKCEKASKC